MSTYTWLDEMQRLPDELELVGNNGSVTFNLSLYHWEDIDLENHVVRYIREDIVKWRESKLIKAAWGQGITDFYNGMDIVEQESEIVSNVYKNAGVKKLP